jgi:very-short-patch-repair endonuclease
MAYTSAVSRLLMDLLQISTVRLVIEVDGEIHQQQAEYDAERDRVLLARGLRLLRIKNEEVRQNLNSVLMRIATACCEET